MNRQLKTGAILTKSEISLVSGGMFRKFCKEVGRAAGDVNQRVDEIIKQTGEMTKDIEREARGGVKEFHTGMQEAKKETGL